MKKGSVKTPAMVLDQPVEGSPYLAVRNVSNSVQILASLVGQPDLVLNLWQEYVFDLRQLEAWSKSRTLRAALKNGALAGKWVDLDYVARPLPTVEEAPAAIQPETHLDRSYAYEILQSDLETAVAMVNAESNVEGGAPNKRYLKEPFLKVLEFVVWAEPRLQNRPKVLAAARERIRLVKAL